jgi:hypothetical protein
MKSFLQGRFQDNISKELFEGSYPIVDIFGQGYVILHQGELRTVGKYGGYNLHPLRVHLKQGEPIRDITIQVDLSGRYIADLLPSLDLSREHYLYGTLELEEAIDPPNHPDRWNPITGSSTIKLNLARWQDLLPYQDERVRSGIVIIRSRLKGEEAKAAQTLSSSIAPSSSASSPTSPPRSKPELEPIPLSFEVAGLSDLLVRVGQEVEEGELLARRSSLPLKRQSFALQAARARYRAGLLEEAEILALEREFQEMEVEYEVRAPLPGTITKIELKGFKEAGLEVVLHLRPDPSLSDRLGLAGAGS